MAKKAFAAAENVPDLTKATIPDYPAASKIGEFPRKKALACKDNGDGTKTICARYYSDGPIILMIKSNGTYKTTESAFNATGDDVAKYWNPAEVPTSETAGEVYAEKSITWTDNKTYSFPYLQFTIAPAANLYMQCTHLTVKKIMFGGDGGMQTYSRSGTVDGPIELSTNPSATNTVTVYQKCRLTINGDISGAANLKVTAPVPHHNPVGYTTFNGSHAGLRGAFMLTCPSHPEDTVNSSGTAIPAFPNLAKELYLQVYMNRGDQFGGRYEGGAAWRSIHVNNYGCINVVGDMTVDEPTRGFFVDGGVQFNVSDGKTLTLGIPVTYGGEMIKKGSGKLVLGGEARFVDGSSETLPQEGANVLAIDKGSLKVTATNALNGVCAKFAKGTELCLDAVPENADMAAYGIINTRWNVPFVCGEDDGAIRVRLENTEAAESLARFSCAICTVAAETAAALKFKVPRLRNFFCGIVRRENADGTVTVAAEYVRRGRLFIKMR